MPLAALIPALLPILNEWLGRLFPDPAEREKHAQALLTQLMTADTGQMAVNKAEAESGSNFRGGWRPAVGWICAAALAWQFVVLPIALWASYALGYPFPKPPDLSEHLYELLFGLLGLSAIRSVEKIKGVAK